MRDVIWYTDNWNYVIWDEDKEPTKYRLIKAGDKYVIQKWFTFTKTTWGEKERITNYSDITDILDYKTAKAKIYILQWKYEVIEEFSA